MKKPLLLSAVLFLSASLPLSAHIADDEKQIANDFRQVKNVFHQGNTNETVSILKHLASEDHHPPSARAKAAVMIADFLRWQSAKGGTDEKLAQNLESYHGSIENLEKEKSDYILGTLAFLKEKKKAPKRPDFGKLSGETRILALGKAARELEKENPLESLLIDEELWHEAQKLDFTTLAAKDRKKADEVAAEMARAAAHINRSFWSEKFTYDLGPLPEIKIFEDILKSFSLALAAKDPAKIESFLHPASPFKNEILSSIQNTATVSLEYSECRGLQWENDTNGVQVTCKVKGTRTVQGKSETMEAEKILGFRKDKDQWRIGQV